MKKSRLPWKLCTICERSFAWRRKWAACWAEVRYCSARCRRYRSDGHQRAQATNG